MEPKTGKRIVSKGAYVGRLGQKVGLSSLGLLLLVFSLPGYFLAYLAVVMPLIGGGGAESFGLLIVGILLGISILCVYAGIKSIKRAVQIDTGVPFTRANSADLPAEDSLVRASEEPILEQQAVLLRAASQGQETPAEELVRASSGT